MALKMDLITETGFDAPSAYIRVVNVAISGKNAMAFDVTCNRNAESIKSFDVFHYSCPYCIEGENPIRQAYLHLKSLPEFADAEDC